MDRGAHYYRCDFQVHTPRDEQWSGRNYVTEEERKVYAKRFIKACREKKLNAVAITDHHDVVFYRYIKEAALSEVDDKGSKINDSEKIIVFPGIEVTIAQPPAQVLILFDPDIDIELYNQVPIKLGIRPAHESEAKTCRVDQLNFSVQEIHDRLCETHELINRFIILPNVKEGGHKTFIREGMHTYFINLPCVGGYIEGKLYDELRQGNKNILEGKDKRWSTRAYGVFQTSDSRREDFSTLGEYSTWVKWSKPSAEALRQACLSKTNRISHYPPTISNTYIERVEVSNSKFLGSFDLELNPQFTALIGGRGTGKSSFLEYLRWGLCDPSIAKTFDGDVRPIDKRRFSLIESTLESIGASVTVHWVINGVKHKVTRNSSTGTIELSIGSHSPRQATIEEIRELIAIQSYSQKELSTVGIDIKELRRFIETPVSSNLNILSNQINEVSARIRSQFGKIQEKLRLLKNLSREKAILASLTEQANTIRDQLIGLPEQSKIAIELHPLLEQEALYINNTKIKMKEIMERIEGVKALVSTLTEQNENIEKLPNSALIQSYGKEISLSANRFIEGLDNLERELFGETAWQSLLKEWENIYKTHNLEYQIAIDQNTQYQQQLIELSEKEKQIGEKTALVEKYETDISVLSTPEDDLKVSINELINLFNSQRQLLTDQCNQLTTLSNGLIQASLATGGDIDEHLNLLVNVLQGSRISTDKLRQLLMQVDTGDSPFRVWMQIVSEIYNLWRAFEDNGADFLMPEVPLLRTCGFLDSELRRLASRIDAEKYLSLLLYRIKEKPIFKYCVSGGDVIDFNQASAGQQASALLRVLLSVEGPPLIIDQPEDDLDNEIVAEIANFIWDAKKKRQIIFASHNANLVVNGDAELVVHFGYRNEGDQSTGEIKTIGSIDVPEIKEAIKNVMEGGERAFKLRIEKYGF